MSLTAIREWVVSRRVSRATGVRHTLGRNALVTSRRAECVSTLTRRRPPNVHDPADGRATTVATTRAETCRMS